MSEQPSEDEIKRWHRWFAVECNNHSWDLVELVERTVDQDREMKAAAFAAAYHWSKIGTPVNDARAEVTIAHILSALNEGEQALVHARNSLEYFQANPAEDWDIAFAWMEVAFAAGVAGQTEIQRTAYRKAHELGQNIHEDEDKRVFLAELDRIPKPLES